MLNRSEFLTQVLEEAGQTFVTGNEYNDKLKDKAEEDSTLKDKYRFDLRYLSKQEDFTINANRIPGTNFIAAAGPQSVSGIAALLDNTAFHATTPVRRIIALGATLAEKGFNPGYSDFSDYCLNNDTYECGAYEVAAQRIRGNLQKTASHQILVRDDFINCKLYVKKSSSQQDPEQLKVTLFNLRDNEPIFLRDNRIKNSDSSGVKAYYAGDRSSFFKLDLTTKEKILDECYPDYLRDFKETLWEIFQESLKEPILVHCTSGVGRTGHFILMMEILKNAKAIFSGDDPKASAAMIHKLLANMRDVRPALVNTKAQFLAAIHNAYFVYEHALRRRYIVERQVEPAAELDRRLAI